MVTDEQLAAKAFKKTLTPADVAEAPTPAKRGRKTNEQKRQEAAEEFQRNALYELVNAGARVAIKEQLTLASEQVLGELTKQVEQGFEDLKKFKNVTVTTEHGTHKVEGLTHFRFEPLLKAVTTSHAPMVVGPAGSGKTFAASQIAKALGLEFYLTSVGSQTSKSDIMGFMSATGLYIPTPFRLAFEKGGVFLMDEIDAGNPNVLVMMNNALSGSVCAFPDGMVQKHKDFRFIATGNTFGTGSSRMYVGRNQLDSATLDRFTTFDWPIDEMLEAATIQHYSRGADWHSIVKTVRKLVNERGWRLIVSPRATLKGAELFELGFTFDEVMEMTLLAPADSEARSQITNAVKSQWRNK